jgi:hypothetical protein
VVDDLSVRQRSCRESEDLFHFALIDRFFETFLSFLSFFFREIASLFDPLNREALLSRADTNGDPLMVSAQRISEALVFLASLFHPRNWFALDLF